MRYFLLLTLTLLFVFSNNKSSAISYKKYLELKCDSIVAEADVLYLYERLAWVVGDMAADKGIEPVNYLVYETDDAIKVIFADTPYENCIYDVSYSLFESTQSESFDRPLTEEEKILYRIKSNAVDNAFSGEYPVYEYDNYELNYILLPFGENYKLYIVTGTSEHNIIPLGNDYLFITDANGDILSYRKFHTVPLFSPLEQDGYTTTELSHSHIEEEPYITATDICTFRLYTKPPLNNLNVYSGRLGCIFKYNLKTNRVTVKKGF